MKTSELTNNESTLSLDDSADLEFKRLTRLELDSLLSRVESGDINLNQNIPSPTEEIARLRGILGITEAAKNGKKLNSSMLVDNYQQKANKLFRDNIILAESGDPNSSQQIFIRNALEILGTLSERRAEIILEIKRLQVSNSITQSESKIKLVLKLEELLNNIDSEIGNIKRISKIK